MFKNKHVVVAMLVAPLLAVMAWFAIDYFVAERPHAAKEGATYKLVAKSSCRYDSGRCDLRNADFELTLRPLSIGDTAVSLELTSLHALQNATLAIVDQGREQPPATMRPVDGEALRWVADIAAPPGDESTLRIAAVARDATWYAEVPVVWMVIRD